MSAQPAKRRKTSPLAATPVLSRNGQSESAKRASYMSPTRASLSRFNPSLLPNARSASAGPAAGQNAATPNGMVSQPVNMTPDQFLQRGQEAFNYIMGNFSAQMQKSLRTLTTPAVGSPFAQVTTPSVPSIFGNPQPVAQTPLGEETDDQMEAMRAAIRARKLQEQSAQRVAGARPASVGRSTPASIRRPAPRASEPLQLPTNDEDDELSMEIGRNGLAVPDARHRTGSMRSPFSPVKPMSQILAQPSNEDEPWEIDPAITETLEVDELSPDAPIPRSQRLNTEDSDELPETPEVVRERMEAEDHPRRGVLFSSPSKRRRKSQITLNKRVPLPVAKSRTDPVIDTEIAAEAVPVIINLEPEVRPEQPSAHPSLPDPRVLAQRQEKARLDKELRELQDKVSRLEKIAETYVDARDAANPSFDDLIELWDLTRDGTKQQQQQPKPKLSSLLTSFLPFSISFALPKVVDASTENAEQFISHAPVKEDDPLPMNSLFTPLSISSITHAPVVEAGSSRVLQKHSITLASPGSLLTCSLDMTIASEPDEDSIPTIDSLVVADLASWTHSEISSWIEARCGEGDVAAIGYGLGRYWDISVKRAKCWMQCQRQFPNLITAPDTAAVDMESSPILASVLSKGELRPHLGRSTMTLRSEDAVLRLHWKLHFDWTGDVESVVSVETALPSNWHETDAGAALRKIPATFDALMRERGVLKAVEVVVGLVF